MPRFFGFPRQEARKASRLPAMLGGLGLGSALLYFYDPLVGRRRRARARDMAMRSAHVGQREAWRTERDVVNRARGLLARLRLSFRPEAPVSDDVLVERVRAVMGHVCTHAGAVEVSVAEGAVTLKGPVLDREHHRVLREVGRVRGVRSIEDQLQPHVAPTNVPGLQEGAPPTSWRRPHATQCGHIMKRDVQTVGERDAVQRAADLMTLANVGFLPVCDQRRRVVGTITDRDIVVRVVAKGVSPASWVVGDVMSRKVVACRPEDELEIAEQFMAQNQVARLPITDEDGTLQGVISLSDIAEHESYRRTGRTLRAVAAREAPPSEKN